MIAASVIVALVTGLSALYIGKTWGTFWDYVAALAWGLMTQTVILSLSGAIDGLGPLGALRKGIGAHV